MLTCLTMVEYRVYIDNTKIFFCDVLFQKSIPKYLRQIQFQSLFRQPFLPIHRFPVWFPVRFLIRLPLRFVSPVPCPVITGHPSESSYITVAPRYPSFTTSCLGGAGGVCRGVHPINALVAVLTMASSLYSYLGSSCVFMPWARFLLFAY